jgi:hypothetical protein
MKKILSILFALALLTCMACATYTTITGKELAENTGSLAPGSWVTLATNTSYNQLQWPEDGNKLIIGVNITGVSGNDYQTINISAGDNPPAFRASLGDLSVEKEAVGVIWIGPLESARFVNSSGYMNLQGNNLAGKVTYLEVP